MGEEARELAELKRFLEKRLEEVEQEAKMIRLLLKMVNESLSSQSFVRASQLQQPPQAQSAELSPAAAEGGKVEEQVSLEEASQVIPIVSRTGEALAKMYVFPDRIVIKTLRPFHSTTPPFRAFFLRKVLEGYRRRAEDLIAQGAIRPEEAFSYDVEEDEEGVIKEIVIRNYGRGGGGPGDIKEIKNTLRWTLDKMVQRER